jgi:hypothetical protein
MKRPLLVLVPALVLGAAGGPAHAGQPCEAGPLDAGAVTRGLALAQVTAARLDATGADVVLLARAGQDLGRYGLRWSHVGFAYRDAAGWRVLHKLNHCGRADAALYRQGLGEFFLDSPHRYEAAFAVLAPEVQARLAPLLRDNARAAAWHHPAYSMVAYPWATTYQQSNQWAIETLAGAMAGEAASRRQVQAWLRQQRYAPTTLQLDALTRLGARLTAAHIAFDDHPAARRYGDRIDTVTADSVLDWLVRSKLAQPPQVVAEPRP